MIQFWAGKISNNKALIAVTSCSNYKINNAVSVYFNEQNDQLINGIGIEYGVIEIKSWRSSPEVNSTQKKGPEFYSGPLYVQDERAD